MRSNIALDPAALAVVQVAFDEAVSSLPAHERTQEGKTLLASRILAVAASGERDPIRLRSAALGQLEGHVAVGSILKRRILQNHPGQGWYWEIVAGHEVMARGLADTHEEACLQAAEAKRERQAEHMHLYGDAN